MQHVCLRSEHTEPWHLAPPVMWSQKMYGYLFHLEWTAGLTHWPLGNLNEILDMGQVTKLWLSCYLVLLSVDSKTR